MKPTLLIVPSILGAIFLAGCDTPPTGAQYIDPNGQRAIVDVGKIDFQDFNSAASDLVQSMLNSNVIQQRRAGQPALFAISRITNDTDQQFDTDELIGNMRTMLLKSGKVQTLTTVGLGGQMQDPLAQQEAAKSAFVGNQPAVTAIPDYTLTGKILMQKTYAGNVQQTAYTFYLTLTDVTTQAAVWEDHKQIVKQGKESAIGF
jgi:uncharacterized protein (TIGR02722 family)